MPTPQDRHTALTLLRREVEAQTARACDPALDLDGTLAALERIARVKTALATLLSLDALLG